ncbi:MAG: HAD family hydrolase [Sphaerochaetaceae bacterium]|nr:HAD family hydrolase [Sphaerochaetaceae bacterium]
MIKAIFFDIDGTLYSYEKGNRKAMEALADYAHKNFSWESETLFSVLQEVNAAIVSELNSTSAIHNRLIRFQRALYKYGIPVFPHAMNMYLLYWNTLIESSAAFEGVSQALSSLKDSGFKIMAVTNMTAFIQFIKLQDLYLTKYFDYILTSEEVGSEKPDFKMFHKASELSGCNISECVYVGDSIKNDYYGALEAGMKAIWFCGEETGTVEDVLSFSKWSDLPGIIGSLNDH